MPPRKHRWRTCRKCKKERQVRHMVIHENRTEKVAYCRGCEPKRPYPCGGYPVGSTKKKRGGDGPLPL